MEAYRDQYATIFNNGQHVVVLGISVDPDTALTSWSRESAFPIMFVSDTGAKVSRMYDVYGEKSGMDSRHVYVIGPDGRITFKMQPFRVLVKSDYDTLAVEVHKLVPQPKEGSF